MNTRVTMGIIYLIIGAFSIFIFCFLSQPDLLKLLFANVVVKKIVWCAAWSFIGIGASLINTRTEKRQICHYIFYYPFVLIVAILLSFTTFFYAPAVEAAYSLSALSALILGFLGYSLNEVALRLLTKK